MRYLFEFNPYKDNLSKKNLLDLKDFCNGYLAYLLDDDYIIKVHQVSKLGPSNIGITQITITNGEFHDRKDFRWEDVKDYMIPFFIGLSKNYKIKKLSFLKRANRVNILIDDTIIDDAMIKYIDRSIKDDDLIGYIDINITTLK